MEFWHYPVDTPSSSEPLLSHVKLEFSDLQFQNFIYVTEIVCNTCKIMEFYLLVEIR